MDKIIIKDKVYLPKSSIKEKDLETYYEQKLYKESQCIKCENLPERYNSICEACPAYEGHIKLWSERTIKNKPYYMVPNGYLARISKCLNVDLSKAKDLRPIIPMKHRIKFTGKLREGGTVNGVTAPNQKELVKGWLSKRSGLIEAPPRTGKTVIGSFISCYLGVRTLIIAHQEDLLKNFYKTFMGDSGQGFSSLTTAPEIEKELGYPTVGIVKKMSDFENLDVALVTYQKFIRETSSNDRIKKYIRSKFTLLIADEIHQGNANAYSKFLNKLDVKYKLGLTATPDRKDNRQFIIRDVLGPVVARSTTTGMIPKVKIWKTGIKGKNYKLWTYAINFLSKNEERNKMLVRKAFKYLREGHQSVIIPVDRRLHVETLVKMINDQAQVNRNNRNEDWSEELAVPFYRGVDRGAILAGVEQGNHRVIIAMMSMMKQGIDLKSPSALIVTNPMSGNKGAGSPMFYQLANRVATPYEGKMQPIVEIMVDDIPQSTGCFKSLFKSEVMKHLRPNDKNKGRPRYKMDKEDFDFGVELLSQKSMNSMYSSNSTKNFKF